MENLTNNTEETKGFEVMNEVELREAEAGLIALLDAANKSGGLIVHRD